MHPFFSESMIRAHERELVRSSRTAHTRQAPRWRAAGQEQSVTIRLARPQDEAALVRLTQLESRPDPEGTSLAAEFGGGVAAALPLAGGAPLGDPFRRTAHLVPLLELRAKQLTSSPPWRKPVALLGAILGWRGV